LPSAIFPPVWVAVAGGESVEDCTVCFHSGEVAVPTFSCAEFGYSDRR
jgi:hypothetical protein